MDGGASRIDSARAPDSRIAVGVARWGSRVLDLVVVLAIAASVTPLVAVSHLPFTDLPEHVAAGRTIHDVLFAGETRYAVGFGTSQYLLYHFAIALGTKLCGDAIVANRVLLVLVGIAWPLSLRALLRSFGRDPRSCVCACLLFWNRALAVGFLPFVAAVPLLLYGLALVVRQLGIGEAGVRPTVPRALGLGVLAVVLFYLHVSAFVVLGVVASGLAIAVSLRGVPWSLRIRHAVAALGPLAPAAVASFAWWRLGSLGHKGTVVRLPLDASVRAIPLWTFDLWGSHVDEACAIAFWFAVAVLLVRGLGDGGGRSSIARAIPFCVVLLLYVLTPLSVGDAGYLNVRLAPLVALFAVVLAAGPAVATSMDEASGRPREGAAPPLTPRVATAVVVLVASASIASAASATFEMARLEREYLGDGFDALVARIPPGARLGSLGFALRSPRVWTYPYPFAGSYFRARGGAVAAYSFAELPHWSVRYAPAIAPPRHSSMWIYHPCAFGRRSDGAYYDYVLVHGDVRPFAKTCRRDGDDCDEASSPLGEPPRFAPIASSGRLTLYAYEPAVDEGGLPFADLVDDPSVCAAR